jgi:hypothetical protein
MSMEERPPEPLGTGPVNRWQRRDRRGTHPGSRPGSHEPFAGHSHRGELRRVDTLSAVSALPLRPARDASQGWRLSRQVSP